jgi:xanthine dehydrogenase accessory factor
MTYFEIKGGLAERIEAARRRIYDERRKCCAMSVYSKAAELFEQRRAFAVATVVRVEGSASAKPGSKALIDDSGKILLGWVGGGCAESAVRSEAVRAIQQEKPQLISLNMQDEVLGVGMPCGGMMDVYIEPVVPQPTLLIAGHGRLAEALAALGHLLNFSVTVHDPSADPTAFPMAERVLNKDLDLSQARIDTRTSVVIATLHKNDHLWLEKALNSDAGYVALIASAHRSKLVIDYLRLEGMPEEKLQRVWAPAGLDLGAASPEEIALSIMSQIVMLRRGGSGRPLRERKAAVETDQSSAKNSIKEVRECEAPAAD